MELTGNMPGGATPPTSPSHSTAASAALEVLDPAGLSAAVFSSGLRLASQFIDRVETGQVAVNLPTSGWDVHHPFGSFRGPRSAFKEQGIPGLRFYTRLKTAAVRFSW